MNQPSRTTTKRSVHVLETHRVLRNTYLLLSMTLLFSAATASVALFSNAAPMNPLLSLLGYFGLLMLVQTFANTGMGLVFVFAFTGFFGYTLGPIINLYLSTFTNGSQLVMSAMGSTAIIFFALSGYVTTTQKDFSYLGGFLLVGLLAVLVGSIAGIFFQMPALELILNFAVVMIFSGFILYDTSLIIRGGQRNYILATIQLYLSIINLFLGLLQIFSAFAGDRD